MLVPDEVVRARYTAWREDKPLHSSSLPVRGQYLDGKPLQLLLDVAALPWSTITQRYERLKWNPKIGNDAKDRLLHRDLVTIDVVESGRSRMKFLKLTPSGTKIVQEHEGTITPLGPGSMEHEYWRNTLRTICEDHQYTVTPEYDLGNQRYVDLRATHHDHTLLIEIETGKSTVLDNITKCQGHGTLIVFFTSKAAHDAIREQLPPTTTALTPESLQQLHSFLNS